ncbi:Uncharacterised protein [Moraxella lacunata]|uniref:HEAT repeat domain-containing protein n=1 Tax=Moraxella lacunata TaxID=477 RepID=A0A378TVW6_MORLA|nr:hypothetical protein [Moraxella lacunata]STZ64052.1 Uncharacterised protein [Moraxella lacunata]
MKIEKLTPNQIAENIILGKYPYNSDEYGEAVNRIYSFVHLDNSIDIIQRMANSDKFDVLCALSFIISESHSRDLLCNHNQLKPIIRKVLSKNCYRANFDLVGVLGLFIENSLAETDDYLIYLHLIDSDNYVVNFLAISYLLHFNDEVLQKLNTLSDFDMIIEFPNCIDKQWFDNLIKGKIFLKI